jgi:hypothetical protein
MNINHRTRRGLRSLIFLYLFIVYGIFPSYSNSFDWLKIKLNRSYEDFDWEILPAGISKLMIQKLWEANKIVNYNPMTILEIEGKFIALADCQFNVYVWEDTEWKNLYQGHGYGFNCMAHFFKYEGKLYSQGRYGYWRGHSETLNFNFETGTWENLNTEGIPKNYRGGFIFQDGDNLISIFGHYILQSEGIFEFESKGYSFDFKSKKWDKINVDMPFLSTDLGNLLNFDLKNYAFFYFQYRGELGILGFEKETKRLFFSKNKHLPLLNFSICYSNLDKLIFLSSSGDVVEYTSEKLLNESIFVGGINFQTEDSFYTKNQIIIFLLLIILVSYIIISKKTGRIKQFIIGIPNPNKISINKSNDNQKLEISASKLDALIGKLLAFGNEKITMDQLDELLEIGDIKNFDYKRVRRSRLIKSINDHFQFVHNKILIERVRGDNSDKRIVCYKIYKKDFLGDIGKG